MFVCCSILKVFHMREACCIHRCSCVAKSLTCERLSVYIVATSFTSLSHVRDLLYTALFVYGATPTKSLTCERLIVYTVIGACCYIFKSPSPVGDLSVYVVASVCCCIYQESHM